MTTSNQITYPTLAEIREMALEPHITATGETIIELINSLRFQDFNKTNYFVIRPNKKQLEAIRKGPEKFKFLYLCRLLYGLYIGQNDIDKESDSHQTYMEAIEKNKTYVKIWNGAQKWIASIGSSDLIKYATLTP